MIAKMGVLRNNVPESFLIIANPLTIDWLKEHTDYSPGNTSIMKPHRIYGNEILELLGFWEQNGYDFNSRFIETLTQQHINIFRDCIICWDEQ